MTSAKSFRVGVVGFGPRALGALEALITQLLERNNPTVIDIFDAFSWPGAGPNYNPEQSDLCILNIPVRVLKYEPPAFMASQVKTFFEWSDGRYHQDDFPPRSDVGSYFHDRFKALKVAASDVVALSHLDTMITGLELRTDGWWFTSDDHEHGPYDEVLLAQGQPATAPDAQLDRWRTHAADNGLTLLPAYPANPLIAAAQDWTDQIVAIRGLGLSTLDVLRMLTTGLGGQFIDGTYKRAGLEPKKILPFSLNGRPPVAKPATNELDMRFDPSEEERDQFRSAIARTVSQQPETALNTICDALIAPTVRILSELGSDETEEGVELWLAIERGDPGAQEILGAVDSLKADIDMAHGRTPPTVGYVGGQVWRKFQHELRECFNQSQYQIETAIALVKFDEGFKRFSYGPPVFAAEELLVMISDGIVSMCTVDDPAVLLNDAGWQLVDDDDVRTASVMIDAVIPTPSIETTLDPLLLACMSSGYVTPMAAGLGAHTMPDGQLIGRDDKAIAGLCMLGRLTIGSVIAVDGLDDCFGSSTAAWANGLLNRRGLRQQ